MDRRIDISAPIEEQRKRGRKGWCIAASRYKKGGHIFRVVANSRSAGLRESRAPSITRRVYRDVW